jgi:glucose dehydrogenase
MMKPANHHLAFGSALLAGVAFLLPSAALAGPVTAEDLLNADANRAEWIFYGRDYGNQRFSPLDQITPENVTELRPVWAFSTGGQLGGLESTPLFREGKLYFSADYSRVFAVDAATGVVEWVYEPKYE